MTVWILTTCSADGQAPGPSRSAEEAILGAAPSLLKDPSTMWIVRLALRRPYTFVVMAMLIADPRDRHDRRGCRPTSSPTIDIPVDLGDLQLPRHVARGDGEADRHATSSASSRRPSTTSSTSRASRSTASASSRSSSSRARRSRPRSRRSPRSSQTAIRQMPPGTHAAAHHPLQRVERADPAALARERRRSPSSSCSTSAINSLAPGLVDRSPACRSRIRTAASSARSWSTSTPSGSTPAGSRRATSRPRSTRRT